MYNYFCFHCFLMMINLNNCLLLSTLFLFAFAVDSTVRIAESGGILDIQSNWNSFPWLSRGRINEKNWAQLLDDHSRVLASLIYQLAPSSATAVLYLGVNAGTIQRNLLHSKSALYRITTVERNPELISVYHSNKVFFFVFFF